MAMDDSVFAVEKHLRSHGVQLRQTLHKCMYVYGMGLEHAKISLYVIMFNTSVKYG